MHTCPGHRSSSTTGALKQPPWLDCHQQCPWLTMAKTCEPHWPHERRARAHRVDVSAALRRHRLLWVNSAPLALCDDPCLIPAVFPRGDRPATRVAAADSLATLSAQVNELQQLPQLQACESSLRGVSRRCRSLRLCLLCSQPRWSCRRHTHLERLPRYPIVAQLWLKGGRHGERSPCCGAATGSLAPLSA